MENNWKPFNFNEESKSEKIDDLSWETPDNTLKTDDELPSEEVKLPELSDFELKPIHEENDFYIYRGKSEEIYYYGKKYEIKADTSKILKEIDNLGLNKSEKEDRYSFNPQKDTELGKAIHSLVKIGISHNLKLTDCHIIKNEPKESFLNITTNKSKQQFIYILQKNPDNGNIIIDFSALGGPSYSFKNHENGTTYILPGWVPFRISQNNSNENFIAIVGYFN